MQSRNTSARHRRRGTMGGDAALVSFRILIRQVDEGRMRRSFPTATEDSADSADLRVPLGVKKRRGLIFSIVRRVYYRLADNKRI